MEALSHILMATDGSSNALRAADYAAKLAQSAQAKVTIVMAHAEDGLYMEALGPAVLPGAVPYSAMSVSELKAAVEKHAAQSAIAETAKVFAASDDIDVLQRWGQLSNVICEIAEEVEADMIVLGTRGRSNFAKLLLGSVSTQVVNHAHRPVLLIP
ncbi:MAG: universal stress protein [Pseudomonadota bacterium]